MAGDAEEGLWARYGLARGERVGAGGGPPAMGRVSAGVWGRRGWGGWMVTMGLGLVGRSEDQGRGVVGLPEPG